MPQGNGDRALGQKYVIDHLGGSTDESSPFYDYWPTMVFFVSPEGRVIRAWLPQKNEAATVQCVEAAIVSDIGGAHQKLKITDSMHSAGLNQDDYYDKYYIEKGVGHLLDNL